MILLLLALSVDATQGRAGGPVRVLYIEELPRWEFRHLKCSLVSDPAVLCHTYLLTADKDFVQSHSLPDAHTPAVRKRYAPFFAPLKKLPQKLDDYDVVVLGDVSRNSLGEEFMRALAKFVRESGGGLVLIAGPRHNPDGYAGSPLEPLLPFALPEKPNTGQAFDRPLGYALTAKEHRIMRFASADVWADIDKGLPSICWYKCVGPVKPGALTPAELRDNRHTPLFVASSAGAGRVFASLTDETWHWRLMRGDEPYFYPFWKRVLNWAGDHKR